MARESLIYYLLHVSLSAKTDATGVGETEYRSEFDWIIHAFGAIQRSDISFSERMDLASVHCLLSIDFAIITDCAFGLIPIAGNPPPDAVDWCTKHPEEWPPWMGIEIRPPMLVRKGQTFNLKITGEPGQCMGLNFYGSRMPPEGEKDSPQRHGEHGDNAHGA